MIFGVGPGAKWRLSKAGCGPRNKKYRIRVTLVVHSAAQQRIRIRAMVVNPFSEIHCPISFLPIREMFYTRATSLEVLRSNRDVRKHRSVIAGKDAIVCKRRSDLIRVRSPTGQMSILRVANVYHRRR